MFVSVVGPSMREEHPAEHPVGRRDGKCGTVTVAEGDRPARLGYVFQDPRPPMADRWNMLYVIDDTGTRPARAPSAPRHGRAWAPATSSPRSCGRQGACRDRLPAVEPDLLLMDEPFSHLDAITARSLREQLQDIWTRPRRRALRPHDVAEAQLPTASSCWRQAADSTPMSTSTCRDPARLPTRTPPRCRRSLGGSRRCRPRRRPRRHRRSRVEEEGPMAVEHAGEPATRGEEVLSSIDVPRELLIGGEWSGPRPASGSSSPTRRPVAR